MNLQWIVVGHKAMLLPSGLYILQIPTPANIQLTRWLISDSVSTKHWVMKVSLQ